MTIIESSKILMEMSRCEYSRQSVILIIVDLQGPCQQPTYVSIVSIYISQGVNTLRFFFQENIFTGGMKL